MLPLPKHNVAGHQTCRHTSILMYRRMPICRNVRLRAYTVVNLADTWGLQPFGCCIYLYSYEPYTYLVVLSGMNHTCGCKLNRVGTHVSSWLSFRNDTLLHKCAVTIWLSICAFSRITLLNHTDNPSCLCIQPTTI